jgi:nitrate reductase NapAB chaperone NapD
MLALIMPHVSVASDDLAFQAIIDESCPLDSNEILRKLDGEFTKARITPNEEGNGFLALAVSCMPVSNGTGSTLGYSMHVDLRFGYLLENGTPVVEQGNRGSMLVGGDSADSSLFYMNAIRDILSDALVAFIQEDTLIHTHDVAWSVLHLMSLKNKENALAVKEDLALKGYEVRVIEDARFNRVVVVVPSDKTEKTIAELKKLTGSEARILNTEE